MKPVARQSAFTLIELLMVIAIIGILGAIALPSLKNFRAQDALAATTRQLQDDVARARQYAISQRTTVYMVFCPSNFWSVPAPYAPGFPASGFNSLPLSEKAKAAKLYEKQLIGYNFVTLRSVGEQPGRQSPQYLSRWRALPEGAIIPAWKFNPRSFSTFVTNVVAGTNEWFRIRGFEVTNSIPFPSVEAMLYPSARPYVPLPYIAFNHLGQLESGEDEFIPVVRGGVSFARDANQNPTANAPNIVEVRPGESTSSAFLLVHIDSLTGRARVEKQEFP